jgi:hypothetical protein
LAAAQLLQTEVHKSSQVDKRFLAKTFSQPVRVELKLDAHPAIRVAALRPAQYNVFRVIRLENERAQSMDRLNVSSTKGTAGRAPLSKNRFIA